MLASIGAVVAPLLIPLGFIGWQLAAAAITGFIAKENVVGTFAVLLAVASEEALHAPGGAMTEFFTPLTAFAYMVFNLFTPPCFAAIGLFRGLAFQLGVGYMLAMLINQIGSLIIYGAPADGLVASIIIIIVVAAFLVMKMKSSNIKRSNLGVEM
jgi:ferrous iron transport protein B